MSSAIDHIPEIWQTLDDFPQTLVHNDCNPRNICLRKGENHTGELYVLEYISLVLLLLLLLLLLLFGFCFHGVIDFMEAVCIQWSPY